MTGRQPRERNAITDIVAAEIRAVRARAGLTQDELAERAGLGRQTYIRLEKGISVADISQLWRICEAIDDDTLNLVTFVTRVEERLPARVDQHRPVKKRPGVPVSQVAAGARPKKSVSSIHTVGGN
jgi:transcriptional regulator with XRE-family HTH domain